jgi:hypothetical protein
MFGYVCCCSVTQSGNRDLEPISKRGMIWALEQNFRTDELKLRTARVPGDQNNTIPPARILSTVIAWRLLFVSMENTPLGIAHAR